MRTIRLLIVALVGVLAIAACSGTPDTIDDAVDSLPDEADVAEAGDSLQDEIDAVSTAIQNSDAADDLSSAWSDMQAEVTEAVSAVTSNGELDTEAIRAEMDEFQSAIAAAGDDVGDELTQAWNELRTQVEALIG